MGRRNRGQLGSALGGDSPQPQNEPDQKTLKEWDAVGYEPLADVDRDQKVAHPLPIMDIYPDPMQPRRIVPTSLRTAWDGTPDTIHKLFYAWLEAIGGTPDDLRAELEAKYDALESSPNFSPVEAKLRIIISLAVSIKQSGLRNAIKVYRKGRGYRISEGEQRWMAHHLLNFAYPGKWDMIAAETTSGPDVWAQAAENNAREDLNAIEKARQLALLLMYLLSEKNGIQFKPIESFEHEQEYYAQVGDGDELPIPYGASQQLVNAMGFTSKAQLTQYRRLLRLPRESWEEGDDKDWSEFMLRPFVNSGKAAVPRTISSNGESLTGVRDSGSNLPISPDNPNDKKGTDSPEKSPLPHRDSDNHAENNGPTGTSSVGEGGLSGTHQNDDDPDDDDGDENGAFETYFPEHQKTTQKQPANEGQQATPSGNSKGFISGTGKVEGVQPSSSTRIQPRSEMPRGEHIAMLIQWGVPEDQCDLMMMAQLNGQQWVPVYKDSGQRWYPPNANPKGQPIDDRVYTRTLMDWLGRLELAILETPKHLETIIGIRGIREMHKLDKEKLLRFHSDIETLKDYMLNADTFIEHMDMLQEKIMIMVQTGKPYDPDLDEGV